jgi:hypothetical protein
MSQRKNLIPSPHPTKECINTRLESLNMTSVEFAIICQCSHASVSKWRNGETRMPRGLWSLFLLRTAPGKLGRDITNYLEDTK